MLLLTQFLLRLAFGLALAMLLVSPRQVTSGYFRNNLYVLLGVAALAALLSRAIESEAFGYAALAAAASYLGSICWLYERPTAGKAALLMVALSSIAGAFHASVKDISPSIVEAGESDSRTQSSLRVVQDELRTAVAVLRGASIVTSGLLVGVTMAAMLLGHWYLNSPTMELRPLQRLIVAMGAAVILQAVVSSCGLWGEVARLERVPTQWILFVLLRWLFGLVGVAAMAWMAWQTLKIPNTQSATGILYVAVIGTFVGETMSLLLSAESLFPL